MSSLSSIEKIKFEKLLEMGNGYVLNFSNRTIEIFVMESTGISLYEDKYFYASGSKANRLRAFWEKEPDQTVGKLLLDLLDYWKTQKILEDLEVNTSEQALYDECSKIANRLLEEKDNQISSFETASNSVESSETISILFLSADPTDGSRLRIGEELREIQEKLQIARLREKFSLNQRLSVRATDISQALLDTQPNIVHFSGHGTSQGSLCLENVSGKVHPIHPNALSALFEQFSTQVGCVILNACYSELQAKAIAEHIHCVIGMNQAIGDAAAIAFAVGFYQALGAGRSIKEAYKLGCVQIMMQNIPEHLTPVIHSKN